jgi:glycosyltransferase involved in cell wall biosynthesis
MKPLVTIITPSFNQADFLEDTILSVLAQDYPRIEYFIIDGGSSDGSVNIIRKYQDRIAGWTSEPDKGQTEAINKGFAMANGDVLAWINSDDIYYPHAVSQAVEYLDSHPEIGLVYGDTNFINSTGKIIGKFNAQQTSYQRLRRGGVYIPQQSSFFRANIWQRVGPLDPDFYFAVDYDLWVRIAKENEIIYVPRLWASFRLHGTAKSIADDIRCWPEMLKVHHREGGTIFSFIYLRYYMRKLLGPLIRWRRRRMFQNHDN